MEALQRDGGGGRRPAARDPLPHIIMPHKEIPIFAVEDHHTDGILRAPLGFKAIELAHQPEIEQIDRWMIDGRPGDAVRDLDTKKIVTVVGHRSLLESSVVTISVRQEAKTVMKTLPSSAIRSRRLCLPLFSILRIRSPREAPVEPRCVPPQAWRSRPTISTRRSLPSGVGAGA